MTAELIPNVPLLLKTLNHIEHHPEEHDQEKWICGTTACFAGHAVLIDGGVPAPDRNGVFVKARDDDDPECVIQRLGGPVTAVRDRAIRILGLTCRQAGDLFDGGNTLDDLRGQVAALVGEPAESRYPR